MSSLMSHICCVGVALHSCSSFCINLILNVNQITLSSVGERRAHWRPTTKSSIICMSAHDNIAGCISSYCNLTWIQTHRCPGCPLLSPQIPPLYPLSFVQSSQILCFFSNLLQRLHVPPLAFISYSPAIPPPASKHSRPPCHTTLTQYTSCFILQLRGAIKSPFQLYPFYSKLSDSCLVRFLSKSRRAPPPRPTPENPICTWIRSGATNNIRSHPTLLGPSVCRTRHSDNLAKVNSKEHEYQSKP